MKIILAIPASAIFINKIMSDPGKKLTFIKKINGKLHRVPSFPQAELKFFFPLTWINSSLMSLSMFSHQVHDFLEVQNSYFCNSSIHYSATAIQQETVHILTLWQVLPYSCTAVVVTPSCCYTFTLLTHKLHVSLALLCALVLRTDHNKYTENYINITYSEKSYNILLQKGIFFFKFDLSHCLSF